MKITKTKEVITEEIEVVPGTYYFEDENIIAHRFILKEPEDEYSEYMLETLYSNSNKVGIIIREDGTWDDEHLPFVFSQFITGNGGKQITKEDFEKERQEVLKRLADER